MKSSIDYKISKLIEKKKRPVQTNFCIFCGNSEITNSVSKNKVPFVNCSHCKTTVFFNTKLSLSGYEELHRLIKTIDPVKFFESVSKLLHKKVKAEEED